MSKVDEVLNQKIEELCFDKDCESTISCKDCRKITVGDIKSSLRQMIEGLEDKTKEFENYADECEADGYNRGIRAVSNLFK